MANVLNSKPYRAFEFFTNLVYLNLLWLLACLPVVTIPAATTAMFGVTRDWVRGDEPAILRRFVSLFGENLLRSLWLCLLWVLIGATLASDYLLVGQMDSLRRPLYVALLALGALYATASVYLFPVMVSHRAKWTTVLRNALLYPVAAPLATLQGLLVVGIAAFVVVSLPVTILVVGSATAYAVYTLCERSFRRIELSRGPVVGEVPNEESCEKAEAL
jgi:uncharacterized membrane protein YesL